MTVVEMVQYVVAVLVLAGALFALLAAVGVLRLPDLYTRMHAASKAGAVGAGIMLLAAGLASLDGATLMRAILGILFLLLTTPVSAHLLARAAYIAGVKPSASTSINEFETPDSNNGRN